MNPAQQNMHDDRYSDRNYAGREGHNHYGQSTKEPILDIYGMNCVVGFPYFRANLGILFWIDEGRNIDDPDGY